MAVTSPDEIYSPDRSDPDKPSIWAASMADSVQDALNRRAVQYRGEGAPTSITGANIGDTYRDTDTNYLYQLFSGGWFRAGVGVYVTSGTSASSGSILSAGGSAQLSAVTPGIALPAGSIFSVSCSIYIRNAAVTAFAGGLNFRLGVDDGSPSILISRRWHSHGASPAFYVPLSGQYILTEDVSSATAFSFHISQDSSSSGPVEIWDFAYSVKVDTLL